MCPNVPAVSHATALYNSLQQQQQQQQQQQEQKKRAVCSALPLLLLLVLVPSLSWQVEKDCFLLVVADMAQSSLKTAFPYRSSGVPALRFSSGANFVAHILASEAFHVDTHTSEQKHDKNCPAAADNSQAVYTSSSNASSSAWLLTCTISMQL